MALMPIPNKAAYLVELSCTATTRETADVPAETKSLKRQAIQLVESEVDVGTWRRTITEYWLESDATKRVRDVLRERAAAEAEEGRKRKASRTPPPSEVVKPGTVAALRAQATHSLADLAGVHMLEVRYAPVEVGLAMPAVIASDLRNLSPGMEGSGRDPKRGPINAEGVYAATLLPSLVEEIKEGVSAAGAMKVMVGAGVFTLDHVATVVKRDEKLIVESVLGSTASSQTRNFITLTFTAKGRVATWLATDMLPDKAQGEITLSLHGKRAAPDEQEQSADLLTQVISFTLTRIPVSWDENRLITVAWMA